jgi:hypothetical protein
VSLPSDGSNDLGLPFRHPTEDEECRAGVVLFQEAQQSGHAADDAAFQIVPPGATHPSLEGRDLEVFFHIDGKVMPDQLQSLRDGTGF